VRNFQQVAANIDVVPLLSALYRQPELWNVHTPRTTGDTPHRAVDDIWCRFRPFAELAGPDTYAEPFIPAMYPAWHALPQLRPIVFGLMARLEAVQLGAVLITRVPPGKRVEPHTDQGRWHPEFFKTKAYVPLLTNDKVLNTCGEEGVVMAAGSAWIFDNLKMHATINEGETDRITLIIAMRCE
jgi:hypothetical protein